MAALPAAPDPILADLTTAQRAAVTQEDGPLLILAGAGTGKTHVVTRRIAHLIAAKRARPEEILALTFTDKAAAEMEERVDLLVPYGYADVWISTFHAFGDRVLREQALHLGLRPDFRVLSQAEQLVFLRDHLFALPLRRLRPLGDPSKHLEALQTLMSRAKDEDVAPAEYLAFARDALAAAHAAGDAAAIAEAEKQVELAEGYAACARLMAEKGLLDFGDQVVLAQRLFREHPDVLWTYQQRFRHILVDEFQDTNCAQWALVRLLAGERASVTVVGDDDQSIYKFRGAAAGNLLAFLETYPAAAQVVLTENYRSPQPILDAAYRLIRHNDPERLEVQASVDKRLVARAAPADGGGSPPRFLLFDALSGEADGVASRIAEGVAAGAWQYRDVAILVRGNRDADPFLRALNLKGIPWRFSGNQGLYAREEVRLLISLLRVLADPEDSPSLYHLAASDLYRVPPEDLALAGALARRRHRSLAWVLGGQVDGGLARLVDGGLARQVEGGVGHLDEPPALEISPEGRAAAARLLKDLEHYRRVSLERPTGEVLYLFLSESGWLKRLLAAASPAAEAEAQNLGRFFALVQQAAGLLRLDRASEFVPHLDALREAGDDPAAAEADAEADAVQVLTVHKAKGLEFPVVFLVNLVADRFPSRSRREPFPLPDGLRKDRVPAGDPHLAEERRLFYVGMTRARRELFLTAARDHGGGRPRKVSRFVLEALDLGKYEAKPYRPSAAEALLRHAPPPAVAEEEVSPLAPGDPLRLSFYQVDDYRTCPLKYKYIHLLRVPLRTHHAVAYGRAIHEAISAYLRARLAGRAFSEAELLQAFAGAWRNDGFLSRQHEELRYAAGEEALRRFLRDEGQRPPPSKVEQPFSVRLAGEWLEGRWDRIDERDGQVAIVDYKSSEVREPKEADRRARESLQLKLYALAYAAAEGRLPDQVELRFVEAGLTGAHAPDAAWAEGALDALREAAAGIRARDFTARPDYLACSTCPFRQICPATAWATHTD